jgi:hypothetical protein
LLTNWEESIYSLLDPPATGGVAKPGRREGPPDYTRTARIVTASRKATIFSALLEKFHSNMMCYLLSQS